MPSSNQLAFVKQLTGPAYYYSCLFERMPGTFGLSKASSTTCEWSFYATLNTAPATPTPSPKSTPSPNPTPSPSPTPTPSPIPTPSPGPTPTAGTPILIQHVATGTDRLPVTTLSITLPNPAGAGNALILGVQFKNSVAVSTIVDNGGNTWLAGPTTVNGNTSQQMSLYYVLGAIGAPRISSSILPGRLLPMNSRRRSFQNSIMWLPSRHSMEVAAAPILSPTPSQPLHRAI